MSRCPPGRRRHDLLALQVGDELSHVRHTVHGQPVGQGSLGGVGLGHIQRIDAQPRRRQRHGQHARHRPQRAGEAQLAQKRRALGQGRYLLRRGQNAQQDGQVVHRALLPHPRRSQIDRDAADGELGPAVLHRRPNALPRLLHRRVRQAHHVEPRQSAGQKALHRHLIAGDARQAQRPYRHHHGQRPLYTNFIAPYILPQNSRREQPLFPKKVPYLLRGVHEPVPPP